MSFGLSLFWKSLVLQLISKLQHVTADFGNLGKGGFEYILFILIARSSANSVLIARYS